MKKEKTETDSLIQTGGCKGRGGGGCEDGQSGRRGLNFQL